MCVHVLLCMYKVVYMLYVLVTTRSLVSNAMLHRECVVISLSQNSCLYRKCAVRLKSKL